jgi:signal transduction histidine kinase
VTEAETPAPLDHQPRVDVASDRPADVGIALVPVILSVATLLVLLDPDIRAATLNAPLDVAINTIAALVATAVAALGWVHFREERDAEALLRASAFLTVAAANVLHLAVLVSSTGSLFGLDLSNPGQLPVLATVLYRGVAAALLLLAGVAGWRGWSADRWPALLVLYAPALVVIGLIVVGAGIQTSLPMLLGPSEIATLQDHPTAPLVVFGARFLVGIQVAIGLGYLGAAALAYQSFRRHRHGLDAFLSIGLIVAAFSQVQFAIHPGVYSSVVTLGDLERVVFDAILLVGLAVESREQVRALRRANAELVVLREADVARATADERARLAREIHDGMSQELWFAKLKQARLAGLELSDEARGLASEVADALESALAEARQAILALRPAEGASFALVMQRFVADFSDRFGIQAECTCDAAADELPARIQAELLRIAQEALTNARKHADPTLVRVAVSRQEGAVRLTVSDNGRGFDRAGGGGSGYGLRSMQERAELIGARLTIDSAVQDGTRVTVELPLEGH